MIPNGIGPGRIGGIPPNHMDMELRSLIANGCDIELRWLEQIEKDVLAYIEFCKQLKLIFFLQIANTADRKPTRNEKNPRVIRLILEQDTA